MLKKEELTLKKLFSEVEFMSGAETDIDFFVKDPRACEEIKIVFRKILKGLESPSELEKLFIKNEQFIDINQLILILFRNYRDQTQYIDSNMEEIARRRGVSLQKLELQQKYDKKMLEILRPLLRDMNTIRFYIINDNENNKVMYLDTEAEAKKKTRRNSRKERYLKDINKALGDKEVNGKGLPYLIQFLHDSDLEDYIFTKPGIEEVIINAAKLNTRNEENEKEFLIKVGEQLERVIEYIDFEKLFLITAYRAEIEMDTKGDKLKSESREAVKVILSFILSKVDRSRKFEGEVEDIDNKTKIHISYSFQDIQNALERFYIDKNNNTMYMTKEKKEEIRSKLLNGEIQLNEIEPTKLDCLQMKKEEIYELMKKSNVNFIYITEMTELDSKMVETAIKHIKHCDKGLLTYLFKKQLIDFNTIKRLYLSEIIDAECIKDFVLENQINDFMENKEIISQYQLFIESEGEEKEKQEGILKKYIELYYELYLEGKSAEEVEEIQNSFLEENLEAMLDDKSIKFFFESGLLSKNQLIEWCGVETLDEIPIQELRQLFKQGRIERKYIENKAIPEIILNPDIDYEVKKQYILDGIFSMINILEFYKKGIIYSNDFDEFYKKGIIGKNAYELGKKYRNKEELEQTSGSKIILDGIPKTKISIVRQANSNEPRNISKKDNLVILPSERAKLFKILGAKLAHIKKEKDDPDSAFYDYNFYALNLDKSDELKLDTIIIAERIYKNKNEKTGVAVDNATYLFKYEDFLVTSNLNKKDMMRERKNIVYRAKHTKSWGINVIDKILQIAQNGNEKSEDKGWRKLIKGLQPYYATNKDCYDDSQIIEILNQAARIANRRIYISV